MNECDLNHRETESRTAEAEGGFEDVFAAVETLSQIIDDFEL